MSVIQPVSAAHASLFKNEALGRAALRKASWRLIPLIAFGYGVAAGKAPMREQRLREAKGRWHNESREVW